MTGAAAAAVVGLIPTRSPAQTSPYTFQVGAMAVTVISDGLMNIPVSFALPGTDAQTAGDLLTRHGSAPNALTAQVNVVVVAFGDRLILIDTGGTQDFLPTLGSFADRFEAAGFKPEAVTDVILTHAHPDHLWGTIDDFGEPRFSRARIHMSLQERDFWLQQGLVERMPENLKGTTGGTQRRLKLLEPQISASKPDTEVIGGAALIATPGHTPGHVSVLLSSGSQSLLVGGDVLSNPIISFEKPDWTWGADLDPSQGIATRKRLLDQLATDKTRLLGYHLPWPGIGIVERRAGAYAFVAT